MESTITFDELPTDMKLFIFSFLNCHELNRRVARMSKKWRRLCSDPSIWRKFIFMWTKPTDIITILNRNHFVRHIEFYIRIISDTNYNWIRDVVRHNSVRSITFVNYKLTESHLSSLISVFPNVEQIELRVCIYVDSDAILEIAKWNRLKSVFFGPHVKHESGDVPRYIPLLAERIAHLEEIEVLGAELSMKNSDFQKLIEVQGQNLKYIKTFFTDVEEESYYKLATRCVNLKHLCLMHAIFMTDHNLFTVLKNLSSLQSLEIQFIYVNLFTNNFSSVFGTTTFPSLVKLTLTHSYSLNDTTLKCFIKCFPLLKDFSLSWSRKITDKGLQVLPHACGLLERLSFELLYLITKECVDKIASQLPQLRYCLATRCPLVKHTGLYEIGNKYARKVYTK